LISRFLPPHGSMRPSLKARFRNSNAGIVPSSNLNNRSIQMSQPLSLKNHFNKDNEYTQTILNNMGDSVFVKDDQSRIILVNEAFCKMMGLSCEEIIGKTLAEEVTKEERESFLKIDRQVLADGIESIVEENMTVRGGTKKVLSTRKSRFVDGEGNKFLVCVVRDITEKKKAAEALRKRESELKDVVATRDRLFSIIAHDLRSPFNNITLLSELLEDSIKKNDIGQSQEYLELINKTTSNTLSLLDNLLDWTKSQTGLRDFKSEKVNINKILSQTLELSKAIASTKNIGLNLLQSEPIHVCSDHKVIKTIVRNLISNAIKFTKPGGRIEVSTKLYDKNVEITVSDDGVGMRTDTYEKLFYVNTNMACVGTANEKGSGFGLVLCKEFVEKLGGTIWAESTLGKGSDFKFTVPINKPKPPRSRILKK